MCMICVDWQKQRMTLGDAQRAFGEMVQTLDPKHAREVKAMLDEAARSVSPNQKRPASTDE